MMSFPSARSVRSVSWVQNLGNPKLKFKVVSSISAMPPTFALPLSDPVFVYKHSTMEVECRIVGGPSPTITWLKDGVSLDNDKRFSVLDTGNLLIKNAIAPDEGRYTCRGENPLGSVEQTTTLRLLSKQVKSMFTRSNF